MLLEHNLRWFVRRNQTKSIFLLSAKIACETHAFPQNCSYQIFSWIWKHMSRREFENTWVGEDLNASNDASVFHVPYCHVPRIVLIISSRFIICYVCEKKLHSLVLDQLVLFYYVLDFHAAKWPFSFPSTLGNQLRGRDIHSSFPQVRGINVFGRVMNWMILFGLSGAVLSSSKLGCWLLGGWWKGILIEPVFWVCLFRA